MSNFRDRLAKSIETASAAGDAKRQETEAKNIANAQAQQQRKKEAKQLRDSIGVPVFEEALAASGFHTAVTTHDDDHVGMYSCSFSSDNTRHGTAQFVFQARDQLTRGTSFAVAISVQLNAANLKGAVSPRKSRSDGVMPLAMSTEPAAIKAWVESQIEDAIVRWTEFVREYP